MNKDIMAKCDVQFLLFAAILCAAAATAAGGHQGVKGPKHLVEICDKATTDDEVIPYCVQVFLKDKAGELTDVNDWAKMSRVVIKHGASNAASIEKFVVGLANNQSLSAFERATLNMCAQSLKKAAEEIGDAAEAFKKMDKITEKGLKDVQISVDDGQANQGKCLDTLDPEGLQNIWKEVNDAYLATGIVGGFLDNVRVN